MVFFWWLTFRTDRIVNMNNARICSTDSLKAVEQLRMKSEKLMIWSDVHKTKIIGTYFFCQSSNDGAA